MKKQEKEFQRLRLEYDDITSTSFTLIIILFSLIIAYFNITDYLSKIIISLFGMGILGSFIVLLIMHNRRYRRLRKFLMK